MISEKKFAAEVLARTGLRAVLGRCSDWSGVLSLAYHRVGMGNGSPYDRELWSASAAEFDAQVRYLRAHAELIAPRDLSDALTRRRGRHVLLTFDDGYRDNYEAALPVLQAHGASAVFFVCTNFLDHPRLAWWDEIAWMIRASQRPCLAGGSRVQRTFPLSGPDREPAIRAFVARGKALPPTDMQRYLDFVAEITDSGRYAPAAFPPMWLTWDMVRALKAAGMEIGGHTVRHPNLAQLSRQEQAEEIAGCGRRLHEELQAPMRFFSFPFGARDSFNADTLACLRDHDVQFGFSLYGGYWNSRRPRRHCRHDIPRVAVRDTAGLRLFGARVTLPQLFA
jgi:peptidoglycan/xylan/chitin deacetylase (PgdA/CDA1 family)